jgi:diaminohydroxyphosphoribosylaminopyrimidine deaminase / 5-amino-6-(5-phosphoribosylamino)uracil reductase
MQRCIALAKMAGGVVAPNPMVGAVLVYEDRIIGEGYHQQYGGPHAEVVCLQSVREEDRLLIEQSTLYVSLEPCAHYGKTPPCADLILQHRIPKVVIGCRDPFILVAGKGIEKLNAAGVDVTVGVLDAECLELNKRFFTYHTKRRPFITLKWAQTADCKIAHANYKRVFISNEYSARLVHQWRSQHTAILVGTNTAFFDDPELTTRLWPGPNPVRLVVDMGLRLPASLKLFDGQHKTIVFNKLRQQEHHNLLYYRVTEEAGLVQQIINALYDLKIQSVLVEGGAQLLQAFINEGLWDEANVITNEGLVLGDGIAAPQLHKYALKSSETVFNDVIRTFTNNLIN